MAWLSYSSIWTYGDSTLGFSYRTQLKYFTKKEEIWTLTMKSKPILSNLTAFKGQTKYSIMIDVIWLIKPTTPILTNSVRGFITGLSIYLQRSANTVMKKKNLYKQKLVLLIWRSERMCLVYLVSIPNHTVYVYLSHRLAVSVQYSMYNDTYKMP